MKEENRGNLFSMFESLPNEILDLIVKHLCYVDKTALRFSCSTLYRHLQPLDITSLVKKELSKYINREDEFVELLSVKKAVLAGSFMVKILYDADWEPGDIDVFEHPKQESEECSSPLEPVTDYGFLLDLCGEEEEDRKKTFHHCLESLGMTKMEKAIWKYKSNKTSKSINYIPSLADIGPMRRIYETFDNDIVKVAFYQNKLYVKDWSKLFARRSYSVPSYVMWIGLYYDYEFTEDFPGSGIWLIGNIRDVAMKEMEARKEKYTKRGFTLIQHPESLNLIEKSTKYSCNQLKPTDNINDVGSCEEKNFCDLFSLLDFNKHLDQEF